jgi:ABC-type amino acid transport system permease subunit
VNLSIPTGPRGPDIANPYVPLVQMQQCEVKRGGRPVWVIPAFLASVAVAVYFAWNSLAIAGMEPHTDSSLQYCRNVYVNGIAVIASILICMFVLLFSVAKNWVRRPYLLVILIPLWCAYLGWHLIRSYQADEIIRGPIQTELLTRQRSS